MSYQDNLARIQQFVSEFNQGNMEIIQTTIAHDFFAYSPKTNEPSAAEVFYYLASAFKTALPNLHLTIENLVSEGELLKGKMTLQGTHEGSIWGAPATGNSIVWHVDIAIRVQNEKYALAFENITLPGVLGVLRYMDLAPERLDLPFKYPVSLPEVVLRVLFTGQMADKPCSHFDQIKVIEPDTDVCEQCVASGDVWPTLRMCLICGFVGCCDTSKNKHMKQHYQTTSHMIFRSIRLEENWVWCYECSAFRSGKILEN